MDIIHNALIGAHIAVILVLSYSCVYVIDAIGVEPVARLNTVMSLAASAIIWPLARIIPIYLEGVIVSALLLVCLWRKANVKLTVFVTHMLVWVFMCNTLMLVIG